MTEKLKPCPFCGGEAEVVKTTKESPWNIGCKNCGCVLFTHYHVQRLAIEAWNRRASSPIYGQWILYEDEDTNAWECSVCHKTQQLMNGTPFENNWHYCPSCGAKMGKELRA